MKRKVVTIAVALLMAAGLLFTAGCGNATPGTTATTGEPASTTLTTNATTTSGQPATTATVASTTSNTAPASTTTVLVPPQSSTTTSGPHSTTTTPTTTELDSGITGIVTIGPISPVEQQGVPNEKPYAATLFIKRSDGTVVTEVRSGGDGRFTVKLPPGTYLLEPQNGTPLPRAGAQEVTVSPHTFTDVTVAYDSGIR